VGLHLGYRCEYMKGANTTKDMTLLLTCNCAFHALTPVRHGYKLTIKN